eukprot:Gb_02898 [translate_table: standard]
MIRMHKVVVEVGSNDLLINQDRGQGKRIRELFAFDRLAGSVRSYMWKAVHKAEKSNITESTFATPCRHLEFSEVSPKFKCIWCVQYKIECIATLIGKLIVNNLVGLLPSNPIHLESRDPNFPRLVATPGQMKAPPALWGVLVALTILFLPCASQLA